MHASLSQETRALALDLHTLLSELDVARWRAELEQSCRAHAGRIETRLAQLRAREELADERWAALRRSVEDVSVVLRSAMPRQAAAPPQSVNAEQLALDWAELRARLQPAYEEMAAALGGMSIHVPTRRPTNYARNVLHILGALVALVLVHVLLPPAWITPIGLALAAGAWSLELSRRASPAVNHVLMRILGSFAHPHERLRVNSSTWYCTALGLLALLGSPTLILVAIAVLGFADPAAAIIGRRYGSIKLVNGRSLQGSGAFVVVGMVATVSVLLLTRPDLSFASVLAMAVGASVLGAVAELFSLRVDDNLSVPVAAAAGAGLMGLLLG